MRSNIATEFAQIFRMQAYSGVEYSYDEHRERTGITVGGGSKFMQYVEDLAAKMPFATEWAWAASSFAKFVSPDTFLLRIDDDTDTIRAVTLYCRFPNEPNDAALNAALNYLNPMKWAGPPPSRIASILGVPGPRGIGLRVEDDGSYKTALYYKLEAQATKSAAQALPKLVTSCGLPQELVETIAEDTQSLYASGSVGVIGIDSVLNGANTIKFNPPNVPVLSAFKFVRHKGASEARIRELKRIADSLRALWVSYLGCKYNSKGFAGWRIYFSVQPFSMSSARAVRLVSERHITPTLRLPHY